MASVEQGPAPSGLVDRVKNILFTPEAEWERIDAEPATVQGLFSGYACILAAIGPIAQLISSQIFGLSRMFKSHPPLIASVAQALALYVLSIAGVFVLGLVIDAAAPRFGCPRDRLRAMKTSVYAWTAIWVAQIFWLLPQISALQIIGVYSFYLLFSGTTRLMKPKENALVYGVAGVAAGAVILVLELVISKAVTDPLF